jgi:hypothetical protein
MSIEDPGEMNKEAPAKNRELMELKYNTMKIKKML